MAIPKKPRQCRVCKTMFQPSKPLQNVCKIECAIEAARISKEKAAAKKAKAERMAEAASRKIIKQKLEKLKTPNQKRAALLQKTEKAIRDYRRTYELSIGRGCISCGRSQHEVMGTDGWKPGGGFDAGHYHGKGARPGLRLEPDNIWLQCKSCNAGSAKYSRKGATVAKQFRENLIPILGIERVEELDADDKPRHWTDEELIEKHAYYTAKLKELKHGR